MRFYLTATAPETRDTEACPEGTEGSPWEDFVERNNHVLSANEGNELVATWGNLANRMLSFAYKRFDGVVPEPGALDDEDQALLEQVEAGFETVGELYNACKFRAALGEALGLAREASGYLDRKLAETVEVWHDDPKVPDRQIGWVTVEATEYVRLVKRIAVRTHKMNGQTCIGVILSTLPAEVTILLARLPIHCLQDPVAVLIAYIYFYDLRSGGVETEFKEDKQGLGITRRNKKRFEAQQMLVQLNALAHNLIVWSRQWLAQTSNRTGQLGILRMVRDVFLLNGLIHFYDDGNVQRIILNQADPFASSICAGLQSLLDPQQTGINLGQI